MANANQLVDVRAVGKPRSFDGLYANWTEWSFMFRSYCSLLSPNLETFVIRSAQTPGAVPMSADADEAALHRDMFHLLSMLTTGKALQEMQRCPVGNGLEAWRRLCVEYEQSEDEHLVC